MSSTIYEDEASWCELLDLATDGISSLSPGTSS